VLGVVNSWVDMAAEAGVASRKRKWEHDAEYRLSNIFVEVIALVGIAAESVRLQLPDLQAVETLEALMGTILVPPAPPEQELRLDTFGIDASFEAFCIGRVQARGPAGLLEAVLDLHEILAPIDARVTAILKDEEKAGHPQIAEEKAMHPQIAEAIVAGVDVIHVIRAELSELLPICKGRPLSKRVKEQLVSLRTWFGLKWQRNSF
jgi:hypothetical protein